MSPYLVTSRHTVYDTLKRWADEGVAGLDAKPKTNKGARKATLKVRLSPDQKKIQDVKNARRLETHFRSPQLDFWQLSETEWFLSLRRPEPVARKKQSNLLPLAQQLPLSIIDAIG